MFLRLKKILRSTSMVVFDFDKTLAATHQASPKGLTVDIAYAMALDQILGTDGLLAKLGGLENRAPGELALAVHRFDPKFAGKAFAYYAAHRSELEALVPRGKGVDLKHAFMEAQAVDFMSELITRVKLSMLIKEVGRTPEGMWPPPSDGVLEFLSAWEERPWGIISSGHDLFITRTLELWGVRPTRFMLTDDDMRSTPGAVELKTKPSETVMRCFAAKAGRRGKYVDPREVIFIGDDLRTDGGLAENSGADFVWYNPGKLPGTLPKRGVEIQHFNELTEALTG